MRTLELQVDAREWRGSASFSTLKVLNLCSLFKYFSESGDSSCWWLCKIVSWDSIDQVLEVLETCSPGDLGSAVMFSASMRQEVTKFQLQPDFFLQEVTKTLIDCLKRRSSLLFSKFAIWHWLLDWVILLTSQWTWHRTWALHALYNKKWF